MPITSTTISSAALRTSIRRLVIIGASATAMPINTSIHSARPTPAADTSAPPSNATRLSCHGPTPLLCCSRAARTMAAGAATSALRCTAGAIAMRYAVSMSQRSCPDERSSAARTAATSIATE